MMHHPLMHYNGFGYGEAHDLVPVEVAPQGTELAALEADAADLMADLEVAAMEVSETISDAVEESRKYDEHRKVLIAGSALVAYVGLTNTKHKGLGLLSAVFGAYVGVKNYQEMQEAKAAESVDLGGYGAAHRKRCVRKKPGRRCPRGYRMRYLADGRVACCRR